MRLHAGYVALATALGAVVGVLPSVASSVETSPAVEARYPSWSPEKVAVKPAGSVAFSNPETIPHGVRWTGGPSTPGCTSGVPVNSSSTKWSGSCSFSQEGAYTYECTVHPVMKGTVYVNASGTVPTTTTSPPPPPPPTTTTTTTPPPTTTTTTATTTTPATTTTGSGGATANPYNTASTGGGYETTAGEKVKGATDLLVAGSFVLRATRHGTVRGELAVTQAAAGGRLQIELLAKRSALPGKRGAKQTVAGRFARAKLAAGKVSFSVALTSRAKSALRRHRRLAIEVKLTLISPAGQTATVTRSIVLLRA